jgi:heme/copper-type cytochrome/quinol oxidase subunit 2
MSNHPIFKDVELHEMTNNMNGIDLADLELEGRYFGNLYISQKKYSTLFFKLYILSFFDISENSVIFYLSKFLRRLDDYKVSYDSVILSDENLPLGYPRLLSVDQVLILPAYTPVRLLITSNDVIHSWALPSHGIKMDAVPGRINQVSFNSPFLGTS